MWKICFSSFLKMSVSRWNCLEESYLSSWELQLSSLRKCVKESSLIHWKLEVCGERSLSCWKCQVLKVSKISSKTFNLLRDCLLYILCSKCCFFKWSPWKSWRSLMVATFTFGSSKCAWCFLNMGFGNLLMWVPPYQVKKLQALITTRRKWRLLHCFVNISWMPNLHTFIIVTMWEVRGRFFAVCMKLRQW